ncbi:hypothetical protein [Corynebacterium diphtheriae]|uniref:hypothetical protein n=1 Tax=Corynebacterium diphtheriae TaxID=1717 RepID=UPI001056CFE9|nr:hypothetical protein [Corynebacterium diphtheriae]
MNILGIAGVLRRKTTRTTVADPTAQRFPDCIQRAWSQAQRPDQWWVADFTYVPHQLRFQLRGFCHRRVHPVRSWRMLWTPEPRHLWASVL